MKKSKIIIERAKDSYSADTENVARISGAGDTLQEAKQSALDCKEILKGLKNTPQILQGQNEVVFKFHAQKFLN